jgi:hypothetical protein
LSARQEILSPVLKPEGSVELYLPFKQSAHRVYKCIIILLYLTHGLETSRIGGQVICTLKYADELVLLPKEEMVL